MSASQILGPGMSGGMLESEKEDAGDLVASFEGGLYRDPECTIAAWCPFGSHPCFWSCPMAVTLDFEGDVPVFGCSFALSAAGDVGFEGEDIIDCVPKLYGNFHAE